MVDSKLQSIRQMTLLIRWKVLLRALALAGGPIGALICWFMTGNQVPGNGGAEELTIAGRATLAVMVWMACWWMTEACHLTVTALLPLVLFPLLGIASIRDAAAPYSDPVIYLFLGSFLLALSMQRWGLGLRVSLRILKFFGTGKRRVIGGIMLVTALFSMFVSNTATVAMMLPIVLGIVGLNERDRSGLPINRDNLQKQDGFPICIVLAMAYAGSIGGIGTIIGTPPNAFLRSFLASESLPETYRTDLSFATWIVWGVPFSAVFLLIAWWLMTFVIYRIGDGRLQGGQEMVEEESGRLGKMLAGEWWTLIIFVITVTLWLARPILITWEWGTGEFRWRPLAGLDDNVIVMGTAILLFLIPCRDSAGYNTHVMNWDTAKELPWHVLILFGGGLSLAASIQKTGVTEFIGRKLVFLEGIPEWLLILFVVTLIIFLTELTSNIATTASLLPVLAGLAIELGISPLLLAIPAAMAASCAFMLPVATPPNALAFGTGKVAVGEMMKAGFGLNIVAIVLVTLFSCTLVRWWLAI